MKGYFITNYSFVVEVTFKYNLCTRKLLFGHIKTCNIHEGHPLL